MTQVAKTHGRLELIHLSVGAHIFYLLISGDAEVFELVQQIL